MIRVDTNYIIRYLINDNIEMANIAENILTTKEVFIANEIIAEVVYVLKCVYNVSKDEIVDVLLQLIEFDNINVSNKNIIKNALIIYKTKNIDFVDSLLCAYSSKDEIATFDEKLKKCIDSSKHTSC